MRNKFPGICYRCGELVKAGDGHFEKIVGQNGWRTQHARCAIKHRGTKMQVAKNVGKTRSPAPTGGDNE